MSRSRRGLLYMPGDDGHKIRKATGLGVDSICMDLEDGVALGRKAEARRSVVEALGTLDFGKSERLVRINAVGSGFEEGDLEAVLGAGPAIRPDGIVLPKAESAAEVAWLSGHLERAEARQGWPRGGIALLVLIETARGFVDIREILASDSRIQAAIFGAEDLAGDVGMTRSREGRELAFARSALVLHAAACGIQAIDMLEVDFRNSDSLRALAREGAALGYTGIQLIHPSQVQPAQEAFTPDPDRVAGALAVLASFRAQQGAGRGAFALDGRMVDMPMARAALRLLERAEAAGVLEPGQLAEAGEALR